MKRNSSFFTRGWNHLDLQSRLFAVFTGLFLFSVLVLSLFLYASVHVVSLNSQGRAVFEQNRRVYRLYALLQQYELAMNHYELNASPAALESLEAQSQQIDEAITALRPSLSRKDQAALDQFAAGKQQLSLAYQQISAAVDKEDWSTVETLDESAYAMLEPLHNQINEIGKRGQDALKQVNQAEATFDTLTSASSLLAVPVFLLLAGLAALVVYQQINRPLERLAQAARGVLNDKLPPGKLPPAALEDLSARADEIGGLAGDFRAMAAAVAQRAAQLRQEAEAIRVKIR